MKEFSSLEVKDLLVNPATLIGNDWMLITAGDSSSFNTMTASWGGLGHMWNKPVAFIVVRDHRYTYEFIERCDTFSLSFLGEGYRKALNICGSKSGRDTDKVKEAGLTPTFTLNGTPAFREAKLILECRKLYGQMLVEEGFIAKDIIGKMYPQKDFHKLYIAEIIGTWAKKEE